MTNVKRNFAFLSIILLLFAACTPEDGKEGDVGPVGPEGQIGPKGDDGNANVNSFTFSVASTDWTGGATKADTVSLPAISQAVVDGGIVQIYQTTTPGTPSWGVLPYSYIIVLNTGTGNVAAEVTIQAEYGVGEIYLSAINSIGANITGSANFPGDRTFKVVIIPPSSKIEGVNHENYKEVEMVYGIKDQWIP